MSDEENPSGKTFDAKAAIRKFQAAKIDWDALMATQVKDIEGTDWTEAGRDAARKLLDSKTLEKNLKEALGTAFTMRDTADKLDYELRLPALRAVDANVEWLEAEDNRQKALKRNDLDAAAEAERVKEQQEREIESFNLLKGMHDATKASATALGEIKAARELADSQQATQVTFNKRMAWTALIVAAGSLVASVVTPIVQEFAWKDTPPKPAVVVIHDSDLTIPPLLRRIDR